MTASNKPVFTDYYQLLDVAPNADMTQVRQAFITQAKQHHPDTGGTTATMQQLNMAYKTLMNHKSKLAYDQLHDFHNSSNQVIDYKYHDDNRNEHDITDMSDDEIDSFLTNIFREYNNQPLKPKPSLKQRLKSFFVI